MRELQSSLLMVFLKLCNIGRDNGICLRNEILFAVGYKIIPLLFSVYMVSQSIREIIFSKICISQPKTTKKISIHISVYHTYLVH